MPRGPQRGQQTLVYLPQSSPGQRQALSMYGKQNPGWMIRPADWGGADDFGVAEGQASWTKVNAPRLPERRKLQRDAEGRIMWDPVSTGLARAAGKTARGVGRAAKRVGQMGGPPMIGRRAPAPGWRVGVGQPRRAAPAPAGPTGPTIAGALPPAGGSSPWAGGGRPSPQAGTPVGTNPQGQYGSPTAPPMRPQLPVGGSTTDSNYRPPIPMRQKNTTTIHRTVGGRTPGRIDYSGTIETTATDAPKMSSGIPTPPSGGDSEDGGISPRKPSSGDSSRAPKTYTSEQREKMDKRNARAKELRTQRKTAVETLSTLATETGNAYSAPLSQPDKGDWLMTQTYGEDLR